MSDPVYHGVENKLKVVVDVLGNAEEWHKEPAARYVPARLHVCRVRPQV